jgi:aminopeptidase YwaD
MSMETVRSHSQALDLPALSARAAALLFTLAETIGARPTGSEANQRAVAWFANAMAATGMDVSLDEFPALDWQEEGATLTAQVGAPYDVYPSPYSLPADVRAPLLTATTVEAIEALAEAGAAQGKLLLLAGAVAQDQLFPRNYPFVSFEEHQRIYRALDRAQPAALLTATARNTFGAGALYPAPMFEDGDFDIPTVYLTVEEGARLAANVAADEPLHLQIRSRRLPVAAANVVARRGAARPPVVVLAHIDSKPTTPGALDNASGVVTLLLLADLLRDAPAAVAVELVALNGEDHYSAAGEMAFLRSTGDHLGALTLGINIDGVGSHLGATAYSLYNMDAEGPHAALGARVRTLFAAHAGLVEGQAWMQSDHALFAMAGVPALAFTSQPLETLFTTLWHTADDTVEQVEPAHLAGLALALRDLLVSL